MVYHSLRKWDRDAAGRQVNPTNCRIVFSMKRPVRNILLYIFIFIAALTAVRLVWLYMFASADYPRASDGILDLRGFDLSEGGRITLSGEWEYYPYVLLDGEMDGQAEERLLVSVPGALPDEAMQREQGQPDDYQYGTYRLRVLTDAKEGANYGFYVLRARSAAAMYVNGELLGSGGRPAETPDAYTGSLKPFAAELRTDAGQLDIIIHVADLYKYKQRGLVEAILFGEAGTIEAELTFSLLVQIGVAVILLMHAGYGVILYVVGRRHNGLALFALVALCAAGVVLADGDVLLYQWLDYSIEAHVLTKKISYYGVLLFILLFLRSLIPEVGATKLYKWMPWLGLGMFFVVVVPDVLPSAQLPYFSVVYVIMLVFVLLFILMAMRRGHANAHYLLLAAVAVVLNVVWGLLQFYMGLSVYFFPKFYPFDLVIAFASLSTYWFKDYFRTAENMVEVTRKLRQSDKQKDDFLANTSHELRNPLHGMLSIAHTVLERERTTMDAASTHNLELLISVGRRMTLLLNDLLDAAMLREGGVRLNRAPVHVQSAVTGVADMLRLMMDGKPVRITIDIPEAFPPVYADENRLVQILFNLLHNAMKYTEEGEVRVSARERAGFVYIRVADTGVGVDKDLIGKMFQPYEQGDSGVTAVGGGIGLGLSICKQLVELHGGSISVESSPGDGSAFEFSIPLAVGRPHAQVSGMFAGPPAAVAPATDETAASEPVTADIRILVVDDDQLNLKILCGILEPEGYEMVTAQSGPEALKLLAGGEWDLVIADVMMPRMSGYELSRTIRERFSLTELPLLLLTARVRPEDVYSGFASGANDYLSKPVDAWELRARVRVLVHMKRSIADRLRTEAAWLQAQIQPHFLFNTLNSIMALSDFDIEGMRRLMHHFSDYLRASFDFRNSEKLVPLRHELGLVRSYIYIEQVRFEGRFEVVWQVDESLELIIPPLSVQPIVENAIRHGLLKRSTPGQMRIEARRLDGEGESCSEISVFDDGVGIDADKLRDLLRFEPEHGRGIGLINIDRRLKQLYGHGLQITSVKGEGTKVSFRIANPEDV